LAIEHAPFNADSDSSAKADSPGAEVVILLTRYPRAGQTKTRMIEHLGAKGAAELQREMTEHVVAQLQPALGPNRHLEVRFAGGSVRKMQRWLGPQVVHRYLPQGEGDLGERLNRAVIATFQAGARAVVVIGADCPGLAASHIDQTFARLTQTQAQTQTPIVFGPAADGGYYLVGLRRPLPPLFCGVNWGTRSVLAESVHIAKRAGANPVFLEELSDVDEPADLPAWERARDKSRTISIIIPTLNDAHELGAALASVRTSAAAAGEAVDIIVADGGSADETLQVAQDHGAVTIHSPAGRARQMNAGAALARGEILLFLHADTELPPGYVAAIHRALRCPATVAGAFRFRVRESFGGKSLLEWATNLRSRWRQMPYGDQGLFVRRWAFARLGGFPELPLMEDYEFVRRIRRLGKVVTIREAIRTSGRRWLALGLVRTTFINQLIIAGYRMGIAPERLANFYRRAGKIE
jgi:rSAM/selenodomain-associated transferase 2/rSAM/selenodomain-associated transferase 1